MCNNVTENLMFPIVEKSFNIGGEETVYFFVAYTAPMEDPSSITNMYLVTHTDA